MSGLQFTRTNSEGMKLLMRQTPDPAFGALGRMLKFDFATTGNHIAWVLGPDMYAESNIETSVNGVDLPLSWITHYQSSRMIGNDSSEYGNMPTYIGAVINSGAFTPETGTENYSNREVYGISYHLQTTLSWVRQWISEQSVWNGSRSTPTATGAYGLAASWYNKDFANPDDYESSDYGQEALVYAAMSSMVMKLINNASAFLGDVLITKVAEPTFTAWENLYNWIREHPIPFSPFSQPAVYIATDVINWIVGKWSGYTGTAESDVSLVDYRLALLSDLDLRVKNGVVVKQRSVAYDTSREYYLDSSKITFAPWTKIAVNSTRMA